MTISIHSTTFATKKPHFLFAHSWRDAVREAVIANDHAKDIHVINHSHLRGFLDARA